MLDLSKYPQALQILMQTDGTVTELIKLFAKEAVNVIKISEKTIQEVGEKVLHRHIFLQGKESKINWLYAESKIYLDNLPQAFVNDLLDKNIPIGTLWINHRIETFKQKIDEYPECNHQRLDLATDGELLTRVYQVYNQGALIMEITEKFPIDEYQELGCY